MFYQLFFIYSIYLITMIQAKESLHIMEDLPIGTAIYTFSRNSCQTLNHTGTYRFVDSQKNSNDFFLIDQHTGRITTKKLIDRDEFCLRRMCSCSNCQITLEVLCVNQGEIFFNDLILTIDDQNDHSPKFPKSSLTIDVLENVPIGYVIPIDIATDLDFGINSIQGYELFENNSTNKIHQAFQIEYSKKTDLLALRLVKLLDRESYQTLNYLIQAYDGGQEQVRFGYLNITINILDVNDMSPMFDRSEIHLLLSESTSIGSLVAHVHAYDRDTGANGLVYYTIVSLDPPSNGTFLLSKETGEIRLGKRLDYEKEKFYRMKVKAQDNGPQQGSMPTFALIHIEIKDENDNYPLITSTFNHDPNVGVEHLLNSSQILIRENLPNGTFLGHISINDLDEGNNGRISWSLESNQSISIKKLFHNEAFLMFTSKIFDREQQSKYDISLQTSDHGQPSLSNQLNFSLIIIDENDNAPTFDRDSYSFDISENTSVNTKIFHFHARDADEENTLNSQIEYRLNNHSFFSLNPLTGELYLIKQLDREQKSSYELEIIASDHGQPQSLSTTVRCTIRIIDVNDNHPQFDQSQYIFHIAETWSKDIPIGHIHATDADEYDRELTYTLVHNETTMTDKWPFELTSTGTLYVKRTSDIDYEQRTNYQFQVIAFDSEGLNTSVEVFIFIENRNDFCPELLFNSTVLYFNLDLDVNHSLNQYDFHLFDGDHDPCRIDLLNFHHLFQLEQISLNFYRLFVHQQPEREYYILQFRLYDLINQTTTTNNNNNEDESCQKELQLILTVGTNQTNQTLAIETAREYFDALHLISKRHYSYFDLTILNVIILIVFLSIAIVIALISLKFLSSTRKTFQHSQTDRTTKHQESTTLYRLQGPTETQLPLLANEPIEQSFISIDQQQPIDSINSKDLLTSTYDHLGHFSTENPYETTQISRLADNQILQSNYYSSPRITQTLKTFSHVRLAEQEIIDV